MVHHRFEMCVGDSLDDAWFLALRFEGARGDGGVDRATPDPRRSESWVGRVRDGKIDAVWGTRTPLLGLARGPSGEAYAVAWRESSSGGLGEEDALWRFTDDGGIAVEPIALPEPTPPLDDLRALADGSLLAWTKGGAVPRAVLRFDGARWESIPPPDCGLSVAGGAGVSLLVAGAEDGRLAAWDGLAWRISDDRVGVQVWAACGGGGEGWAASFSPDTIVRWDGARWSLAARASSPVCDLAVWRGALYAAVFERGLHRLEGGALAELVVAVAPRRLHAGARALVMTEDGGLADTEDLREARWVDVKDFAARVADVEPLWRTAMLDSDRGAFVKPSPRREPLAPVRFWPAQCVGAGLDDAFFLGARSDDVDGRVDTEACESVVGRIVGGAIQAVATTRVALGEIGRAPSGRLYAAAWKEGAGLWRTGVDGALAWERLPAPATQGLFVLDDECVMGWGGLGEAQRFYLFDGRDVRPIPAPPARAVALDGCAPDFIVAVGHRGMVARWDGAAWQPRVAPTRGTLGAVHVLSPDEMYATGPCGALFEGARHGWAERAPVPGAAVGVAKFRGEVYVGDAVEGLLRLDGDALVPVDLPAFPGPLHAGARALLMVEPDGFAETADLAEVRRVGRDDLEVALRRHWPLWR